MQLGKMCKIMSAAGVQIPASTDKKLCEMTFSELKGTLREVVTGNAKAEFHDGRSFPNLKAPHMDEFAINPRTKISAAFDQDDHLPHSEYLDVKDRFRLWLKSQIHPADAQVLPPASKLMDEFRYGKSSY